MVKSQTDRHGRFYRYFPRILIAEASFKSPSPVILRHRDRDDRATRLIGVDEIELSGKLCAFKSLNTEYLRSLQFARSYEARFEKVRPGKTFVQQCAHMHMRARDTSLGLNASGDSASGMEATKELNGISRSVPVRA